MLRRLTVPVVIAAVGTLSFGVAACGSDAGSIAAQARSGDGKGYVSGDGSIERLAPDKRSSALTLSGTTMQGTQWKVADARGHVLVLNVWGQWCGPCVAEMPHLQQVWSQLSAAGKPVQFMGINYRDGVETAKAFLRANRITYPSLQDDGGGTLLALRGKANTTPTTLVLDRQGRIAARVSGPVTAATLSGLVDDVVGESA
ncbi:MAG TPA: TlpA disulfide reductase family protein [Dermatophilaceae bacterium]|nr:TlpA disulfide reductase family protein [Dermatophilaceae bacterium]